MDIEIILREPNDHHKIATWKNQKAVPRVNDYVTVNEVSHIVHSVFWSENEPVWIYVNP